MKTSLSKGLDKQDRAELEQNFIQAQVFRKALSKSLQDRIEAAQASMRDDRNYESPAWAQFQADRLGQIKALQSVLSLLS